MIRLGITAIRGRITVVASPAAVIRVGITVIQGAVTVIRSR